MQLISRLLICKTQSFQFVFDQFQGIRDESEKIDRNLVNQDVGTLYEASTISSSLQETTLL